MYSEALLDHFQFPRNVGRLDHADAEARDENPICGDVLQMWFQVDAGLIVAVGWQAEGCAPLLAAASAASELLKNMPVAGARTLNREDIEMALGGLPARKSHAAALVISVVQHALGPDVDTAS